MIFSGNFSKSGALCSPVLEGGLVSFTRHATVLKRPGRLFKDFVTISTLIAVSFSLLSLSALTVSLTLRLALRSTPVSESTSGVRVLNPTSGTGTGGTSFSNSTPPLSTHLKRSELPSN